jgi:hypothetical protein
MQRVRITRDRCVTDCSFQPQLEAMYAFLKVEWRPPCVQSLHTLLRDVAYTYGWITTEETSSSAHLIRMIGTDSIVA